MARETFVCPICKKYRTKDIVFECIDCEKTICAYCVKRRRCLNCFDKWEKVDGKKDD